MQNNTWTLYRSQFRTKKDFENGVKRAKQSGAVRYALVDDGNGGIAYKFFSDWNDAKQWERSGGKTRSCKWNGKPLQRPQ